MSKEELTPEEKVQLVGLLSHSLRYRNRKLKELLLILFLSLILLFLYFCFFEAVSVPLIGSLMAFGAILFIVLFIAWASPGQSVKTMKRDLESGFKIVGESRVETVNFFTRNSNLADGRYYMQATRTDTGRKVIEFFTAPR